MMDRRSGKACAICCVRYFSVLMIGGPFPKMTIKPYIGELVQNYKFNLILILKFILKMSYSI